MKGTTEDTRLEKRGICQPGVICASYASTAASSRASYPPSMLEEYPQRKNIHDRHKGAFLSQDATAFLHPMLPAGYISRIPAPEDSIEEGGLHYPWQTPSKWTYPAGASNQDGDTTDDMTRPRDPNGHSGGIPDVADEECLKRTNIPWTPQKGNKVYLNVTQLKLCFSC